MTKEIELTQGMVALVDDEDYEWLNQWRWCVSKKAKTYYAQRNKRKKTKQVVVYMHREILGLKYGDKRLSDHINRNELDNRRKNLRIVDHIHNGRNNSGSPRNKSGHKGVCWHITHKKWMVNIKVNGRTQHLGYYDNINNAVEARKQGEIDHWHN